VSTSTLSLGDRYSKFTIDYYSKGWTLSARSISIPGTVQAVTGGPGVIFGTCTWVNFGASSSIAAPLSWRSLSLSKQIQCNGRAPIVTFENGINANIDAYTPIRLMFTSSGRLAGTITNWNTNSRAANLSISTSLSTNLYDTATFKGWNMFISSGTFNNDGQLVFDNSTFNCLYGCRIAASSWPATSTIRMVNGGAMIFKQSYYGLTHSGDIFMAPGTRLLIDTSSISVRHFLSIYLCQSLLIYMSIMLIGSSNWWRCIDRDGYYIKCMDIC
jgi:hypothetical protein